MQLLFFYHIMDLTKIFPISGRLMVKVVEQSEGRDRRGRISRTRRVCPGDTRHRHSDSIWQRRVMYNDACKMSFSSLYYYYLAWSLFICYLRLWFLINTLFDLTSNLSTPDKKPDSRRRPDITSGGSEGDWKPALWGPLWKDEAFGGHIIIPFNLLVQQNCELSVN